MKKIICMLLVLIACLSLTTALAEAEQDYTPAPVRTDVTVEDYEHRWKCFGMGGYGLFIGFAENESNDMSVRTTPSGGVQLVALVPDTDEELDTLDVEFEDGTLALVDSAGGSMKAFLLEDGVMQIEVYDVESDMTYSLYFREK